MSDKTYDALIIGEAIMEPYGPLPGQSGLEGGGL